MKKTLIALTIVATSVSAPIFAATSDNQQPNNEAKPLLIGAGSGALVGGVIAGPPGAVIGALFGMFIGQDHSDQQQIDKLHASLNQTQQQLDEESQALLAAERSIAQYKDALNDADESLRQAKLSELVTQVQFKTGDATVSPVFHEHLDNLAQVMKDDPSLKLNIQGYADVRGDEQYNQTLSEQRALNIKHYLVSSGVSESRLTHSAFGETASIGSDFEEHFFDRKVVMTLSTNKEAITVKR